MANTHPQIIAFENRLKELGITRSDMYKAIGIYKEKYGNWRTRGIPKGEIFNAADVAKCEPEPLKKGVIVPLDQRYAAMHNIRMDIYELRRENARKLAGEFKPVSKMSAVTGRSQGQISKIIGKKNLFQIKTLVIY